MKKILGILVICAAISIATGKAEASLITNGSFETGPTGDLTSYGPGPGPTGWTVTLAGIEAVDALYWAPSDGIYSLDLNGGDIGGIKQSFSTTPGDSYLVTFDMFGNTQHGNISYTMLVDAAGQSQSYTFDYLGQAPGWINKSFSFVANSTSTILDFSSTSNTGSAGPALDNVIVTQEIDGQGAGVVPEPATLSLLGLGLSGMLFRRKRVV